MSPHLAHLPSTPHLKSGPCTSKAYSDFFQADIPGHPRHSPGAPVGPADARSNWTQPPRTSPEANAHRRRELSGHASHETRIKTRILPRSHRRPRQPSISAPPYPLSPIPHHLPNKPHVSSLTAPSSHRETRLRSIDTRHRHLLTTTQVSSQHLSTDH